MRERAMSAKAARDSAPPGGERSHAEGRLMGLAEAVSLMQHQAASFGIDPSSVGLDDIDPERDLL